MRGAFALWDSSGIGWPGPAQTLDPQVLERPIPERPGLGEQGLAQAEAAEVIPAASWAQPADLPHFGAEVAAAPSCPAAALASAPSSRSDAG